MASANSVQVRRPRITVPGASTDSVTYQASVPISSSSEGCPSIRYSSHSAGSAKVENPTAQELIQKIATAQEAMFQPPVTNVVNMEDGSGNSATFTGYDTGPHHDIMFGGLNNGKNLVHRCARLFYINTSIYRPPPRAKGQPQTGTAQAIEPLAKAANPCEALKIVLENIIKEFLLTAGAAARNKDFVIRMKMHEDNTKIFNEEWYPILNASTDSGIPAFAAAMESKSIRINIYDQIRSVYMSGSADFSTIISQFESLFQMRFIPGHMGTTPGIFIPMSAVLTDAIEKEVNISSLSMNPGPRKFLSPTSVAIRGTPPSPPQGTAQAVQNAGSDMIVWPMEIPAAGQTVLMQMPSWLPSDSFPAFIPKTGKSLDFNANFEAIKGLQAQTLVGVDLINKICLDIARLTYNHIALGDAFASIVCPLDISWELGKRYSVKQPSTTSGGSSTLFSGFLRDVRHRISSNPSKAEAVTQLTFSHVEANGFTLPNK